MRSKGQIHGKSKKLNEDLEKGWFIVDCKICNHGKFSELASELHHGVKCRFCCKNVFVEIIRRRHFPTC